MNKNFAMMVLQTVSHARAEACPPPCVNTTNKLQPFGHRRGIKTSTRPMRFAQVRSQERLLAVLPLLAGSEWCSGCSSGRPRRNGHAEVDPPTAAHDPID